MMNKYIMHACVLLLFFEVKAGMPRYFECEETDFGAVKQSAENGDRTAQLKLGWRYLIGRGTHKDLSMARQLLEGLVSRCADEKDVNAFWAMLLLGDGYTMESNDVKAIQWYDRALMQQTWLKPYALLRRAKIKEKKDDEGAIKDYKQIRDFVGQHEILCGPAPAAAEGLARICEARCLFGDAANWYHCAYDGYKRDDGKVLVTGAGRRVCSNCEEMNRCQQGEKRCLRTIDMTAKGLKNYGSAMSKETLVFKGLYLGMKAIDVEGLAKDYPCLASLTQDGQKRTYKLDDGYRVESFGFSRCDIDQMFKTEGVSSEAFCKSLLSAYPIIEKLETKYETIADVERQKKYKQDAENAAMRTFANMASNGQDAYELGAAIGSKIRMNANQMTKEVPYYFFESPKGFVLEIHPDRPEMFFVLRSIAAIDTSNFD